MPKKTADGNRPRGPVTAYVLFVRTCREELRRKYPQLTVDYSVISRKCSERWKSMNDNEKKRFNDIADIERKRYKEELAIYQQEQSIKQQYQEPPPTSSILDQPPYLIETVQQTPIIQNQKKQKKKQDRKPKDPHAPKKPLSAYFLFCADERPKVQSLQPGLSVSEIARELGNRWKQTPPEAKSKYEQAASEKKHVYQAELALYKHQGSTSLSPPETPETPLHDSQSTTQSTMSTQSSLPSTMNIDSLNENKD